MSESEKKQTESPLRTPTLRHAVPRVFQATETLLNPNPLRVRRLEQGWTKL
jgi:hypothetical protein